MKKHTLEERFRSLRHNPDAGGTGKNALGLTHVDFQSQSSPSLQATILQSSYQSKASEMFLKIR